jgi:hypothetical protein
MDTDNNSGKDTLSTGSKIVMVVIVVVALIAVAYFIGQSSNSQTPATNPTTSVTPNTQVKATTVQVSEFYNGQDGYSLSIPSGNNSTCVWTWVDGSAAIPYSKTTYANSATEKHTIEISDTAEDWKVSCTDDFGNQYVGVFPAQSIQNQPQSQTPTPTPQPSYYTPMTFSPAVEAQRSSFVNSCTSSGGTWGKCNCDFDYLISNHGLVWLIDESAYVDVNGVASSEFRSSAQLAAQSCSVYSN